MGNICEKKIDKEKITKYKKIKRRDFSSISPINNSFNDLMEIRDIINHYYTDLDEADKKAFQKFLKAEYFLKQRKISEASQLLNHIIDQNHNLKIIPMIFNYI